jgi:hypothetical protein
MVKNSHFRNFHRRTFNLWACLCSPLVNSLHHFLRRRLAVSMLYLDPWIRMHEQRRAGGASRQLAAFSPLGLLVLDVDGRRTILAVELSSGWMGSQELSS